MDSYLFFRIGEVSFFHITTYDMVCYRKIRQDETKHDKSILETKHYLRLNISQH